MDDTRKKWTFSEISSAMKETWSNLKYEKEKKREAALRRRFVTMTKIWTLSTGLNRWPRVYVPPRILSALVENRAEGDPVTQFLVELRKIVSSYVPRRRRRRHPSSIFLSSRHCSSSWMQTRL